MRDSYKSPWKKLKLLTEPSSTKMCQKRRPTCTTPNIRTTCIFRLDKELLIDRPSPSRPSSPSKIRTIKITLVYPLSLRLSTTNLIINSRENHRLEMSEPAKCLDPVHKWLPLSNNKKIRVRVKAAESSAETSPRSLNSKVWMYRLSRRST